jgi:hypothetical protein
MLAAAVAALPEFVSASALTDQQFIGPSAATKQTIMLKANTKMCLAVHSATKGSPVELATCVPDHKLQIWTYNVKTTELMLLPTSSKLCLNLVGSATTHGTKLEVAQCNGQVAQKWIAGGMWQFLSQAMGSECIDVPGGDVSPGVQLQIWDCSGAEGPTPAPATPTPAPPVAPIEHQQWVGPSSTTKDTILFKMNTMKCVDLAGGKADNGTPVQIWVRRLQIWDLYLY